MPEKYYQQLLENNRKWVEKSLERDPEFFKRLAEGQQPPVLWIGCSDSRVPANEITGTRGGEIFVHRNIANMVVHADINMLSVLQYAVEVLKVDHVIVCGHYGCGGVAASTTPRSYGLLNKWLRNIKEVYRDHRAELDAIPEGPARMNRFVELNVIAQVENLAKTTVIQRAWKDRQGPTLHGWVYDVADGYIHDLVRRDNLDGIDPIFHYNFD
jgi:carbonic anhydrase